MESAHHIELLENDIAILREQINNNQEDIARLEQSKMGIINDQEELGEKQVLTMEPDLSSDTWDGDSAHGFVEIRDSIAQEFKEILHLQTEVLIDNIAVKISQLDELIETYEDKIREKESEIMFYRNL